jgi:hypothetical protein
MPDRETSPNRIEAPPQLQTKGAKVLGLTESKRKSVEATLQTSRADGKPFYFGEVDYIRVDTKNNALQTLGINAYVLRIDFMTFGKEEKITSKSDLFQWVIEWNPSGKGPRNISSWRPDTAFPLFDDALTDMAYTLPALIEFAGSEPLTNEELVEKNRQQRYRVTYVYPRGHRFEGVRVHIDKLKSGNVPVLVEIVSSDPKQIDVCAKELGLTLDPKQRGLTEEGVLRHYGLLK